jgi:hypothetical protein
MVFKNHKQHLKKSPYRRTGKVLPGQKEKIIKTYSLTAYLKTNKN